MSSMSNLKIFSAMKLLPLKSKCIEDELHCIHDQHKERIKHIN